MTQLTPDARALIEQALREEEPTAADRTRNRAAIATRIAAGGVIASTSTASAKIAGLAKLFAVCAFAGTFGVALSVDPVDDPARDTAVTAPPERAAARTAERAGAQPVEPQPAPAPVREAPPAAPSAQPARSQPQPAKQPQGDTLTAETALVRKAHLALRAGDAEGALAHLAQHARAHPQGQLREEREAARVLALCRLGRKEEARRAAGRMLSERSPLAERIKSACGF